MVSTKVFCLFVFLLFLVVFQGYATADPCASQKQAYEDADTKSKDKDKTAQSKQDKLDGLTDKIFWLTIKCFALDYVACADMKIAKADVPTYEQARDDAVDEASDAFAERVSKKAAYDRCRDANTRACGKCQKHEVNLPSDPCIPFECLCGGGGCDCPRRRTYQLPDGCYDASGGSGSGSGS